MSKAPAEKSDIREVIEKGVAEVIVKEELLDKLQSGKKLNIKLGIDPTGSDLHIGHMVPLRKLQQFQRLGHQVILIFGNFTGTIGDPSDKLQTRKGKTQEQLEKNAEHYLDQVRKSGVLDIDKIKVRWNADWLAPLSFADVTRLASIFTVQQMMERDMYQERLKRAEPIYVHEFMYPLMQGYDSVALAKEYGSCDVELGGTDQTFNLLAGREIMRAYGHEPQCVLTVPLLEGTDGTMKMGKTTGNYIGINEPPEEMYGKVMSIPDHIMIKYFELATNLTIDEIAEIKKSLAEGENPRNIKMRLARELVTLYHGGGASDKNTAAAEAEAHFIKVFQKKENPDDIKEIKLSETFMNNTGMNIIDIIMETGAASSKGEARRLIQGGGVKYNGKKIEDINDAIAIEDDSILQVGKRQFFKLKK